MQTDFGETYAPVGRLTIFPDLISQVGRCGWNSDQLGLVTVCHNPDVGDDDIEMMLPDGWPPIDKDNRTFEPPIIVRLTKAL